MRNDSRPHQQSAGQTLPGNAARRTRAMRPGQLWDSPGAVNLAEVRTTSRRERFQRCPASSGDNSSRRMGEAR